MIRSRPAIKARRVVIVRQPWLGDTGLPHLEKLLWNLGLGRPCKEQVNVYCAPKHASHLLALTDARAARVASDLGVDQLDLLPLLERDATTFHDFLHFTPNDP